jgi:hypothetical protein
MEKEKFLELTYLYLMDELGEDEKVEFENTIMEDDNLRQEFESVKHLYESISENKPAEADEKLLTSARYSLMRAVRHETEEQSVKGNLLDFLKSILISNYKFAFSGAGIFLIGLFVGYLFFISSTINKPILVNSKQADVEKVQTEVEEGGVKISNIRIPTKIIGGGQIEVSFDAVKPISYKANVDDPFVQKLLASALVNEKNPGLRLRTVNAISSQLESEKFKIDPKIKSSLITALRNDKNPAVRREALNALTKFPFDKDIRDAYLSVLSNDKNSGMRVAAINALTQLKVDGAAFDEKIINELSKKAENDESNFIRLRAASLVQEVM